MSITTSVAQLQSHLDGYSNEINLLVNGKKAAAPRARKHLQQIKELAQKLRAEVLAHSKPEKKDVTVPATEDVAAAAATILEMASAPPKDTIPSPLEAPAAPSRPKRVRKAPKKSI